MATFSITEAAGSGFRIIGKRPLSFLAWGLAYTLLVGLPVALVFAWMGPDLMRLVGEGMRARGDLERPFDPSMMMPFQGKMMLLQPVLLLSGLLGRAVLTGAVFRAVLEPNNRGFAGLRIGGQELWLALLLLAFTVLMVLFCLGLTVACGLVGLALTAALSAAHAATGWTALAWAVVCVIGFITGLWIVLRFSMAFPMTFAEREFRLFESWRLTRGHAWRLFGLALLLMIILIAIIVVVYGAIFGVALGVGLSSMPEHGQRLEAFFRQPPEIWLRTLAPWAAVALLVGAWLTGAVSAITLAPWATAYKGLAGRDAVLDAFDEPYPAAPAPEHHDHGAGHGEDHSGGHDDGHHGH